MFYDIVNVIQFVTRLCWVVVMLSVNLWLFCITVMLLFEFIILIFNVFFSVVEGNQIKVGEKVYCECQYSEHLPFKWNATKVQLIQSQLTYTSTPSNQVFVSHPLHHNSHLNNHLIDQKEDNRRDNRENHDGINHHQLNVIMM